MALNLSHAGEIFAFEIVLIPSERLSESLLGYKWIPSTMHFACVELSCHYTGMLCSANTGSGEEVKSTTIYLKIACSSFFYHLV